MRLFYLVLDHLHEEETTTRCSMTHLKAEYVLFVLVSASAFLSSCRSNVPSLTNFHASQLNCNIHTFILLLLFMKKTFMDLPSFSLSSSRWSLHHFTALRALTSCLYRLHCMDTTYHYDVFKCRLVFLFKNVTWAFQNVIHIFVVTSDCPSDLILLSCLRTTRQTLSLHYNQHTAPADGRCVGDLVYPCIY